MTGYDVVKIALEMLNYPDLSSFEMKSGCAETIVNQIYSDLFYLNNKSGFKRLNGLEEEIDLDERILNDIMPYGVAGFLAEAMNDGEQQQIFIHKYNQKRLSLTEKDSIKDVLPIPN